MASTLDPVQARPALRGARLLALVREAAEASPVWTADLRRAALDAFEALDLPSTRDEEWLYTNVAVLGQLAFVAPEPAPVTASDLAPYAFGPATAAELVFVNGRFVPALSSADSAAGLVAASLATLGPDQVALAERWLGRVATHDRQAFTALNTAGWRDGALIHIAPGTVLDRPVHVLFVSTGAGSPVLSHPRTLLVVGEHAECRVIESYVGLGDAEYCVNPVTEIVADERAIIDHYRVGLDGPRAYHVGRLQIQAARASTVSCHGFTFGGQLVRNDLGATLAGEGAEVTLNGLYVASGSQLVDNHTTIDHAQPHCPSHELYRGILGDRARAVFNGKIIVRPDAQKTDAKQTNKALLLSDDAQVNSKPQLEIFADDVKCTHGATVGQLDDDALFYLRARGLALADARALLVRGFAEDVINRVRFEPLRERLDEILLARVPARAKG